MRQQVKIQVSFKESTKYGEYNDALYFSESEYATKTKEEIDALVQERVDNYVDSVENAPTPEEPTKEELEKDAVNLQAQLDDINNKIEELEK